MQSFNRITLCGHVARLGELRMTASGQQVFSFSIGTSNYKHGDETEPVTTWFNCVIFGDSAVRASQMLKKSTTLFAQGRLEAQTWQAQDGQPRTSLQVVVSDWRLLEKKAAAQEEEAAPPAKAAVETPDDSIPF